MPSAGAMKLFGMDKYAFNAQLKPAFFVLLPVLVFTIVHYPAIWFQASALLTLLVTCGATFLIAQLSRSLGRQLEHTLGDKIGRQHTARLLAYSNTILPRQQKERCRDYILAHSGISLPTEDEEQTNADSSQDDRLTAVSWLLEYTRPTAKETLLHDENIAYGFRRNLLGLKPIGAIISILLVAINPLLFFFGGISSDRIGIAIALEMGLIVCCLLWLFVITERFVIDASLAYAQRLLAHCQTTAATQIAPDSL